MADAVVLIGAGGHAREVIDIFDAINQDGPTFEVLGYIVEAGHGLMGSIVNGLPILGDFNWLQRQVNSVQVIAAVGASELRRRLVFRARDLGAKFCNAVHPSVALTRWVELGAGVVVAPGSVLTNRISIGNHVHINLSCTISHDCILEDFVTLSPGVHLAGGVRVREGAFLGVGVNVIPQREIGSWSIVGAGAAVVRDIPGSSIAVGVPARVRSQRSSGWHEA